MHSFPPLLCKQFPGFSQRHSNGTNYVRRGGRDLIRADPHGQSRAQIQFKEDNRDQSHARRCNVLRAFAPDGAAYVNEADIYE